jgi:decaprenylphospho-beta-D-ribofuranose 2-oxidase
MLLNRPNLWVRVLVEWLIRSECLNGLLWRYAFRYGYRNWSRYLDDLDGFTFFMDGNVHAKRVARRFGVTLKTIQQSFVVPADRSLVAWLEYGQALLQERRLQPTLLDVIYLPQDLPFPLSATADGPGFAVSYGFETNRAAKLEKVADAFRTMSDHLLKEFGGKVYLVKNVRASERTLADMYGANASSFFALKDELDPHWVLCNTWLEETFRGLLPNGCRARARAPGPPAR